MLLLEIKGYRIIDDHHFLVCYLSAEGSFLDKFFKTTAKMSPMEVSISFLFTLIFDIFELHLILVVSFMVG